MAGSRHLLQDTLEDVVCPSLIAPVKAEVPRPFNISLGQPLIQFPVVSAAFLILDILALPHKVSQASIGQLMLSPFWSAVESEGQDRALIEVQMRK